MPYAKVNGKWKYINPNKYQRNKTVKRADGTVYYPNAQYYDDKGRFLGDYETWDKRQKAEIVVTPTQTAVRNKRTVTVIDKKQQNKVRELLNKKLQQAGNNPLIKRRIERNIEIMKRVKKAQDEAKEKFRERALREGSFYRKTEENIKYVEDKIKGSKAFPKVVNAVDIVSGGKITENKITRQQQRLNKDIERYNKDYEGKTELEPAEYGISKQRYDRLEERQKDINKQKEDFATDKKAKGWVRAFLGGSPYLSQSQINKDLKRNKQSIKDSRAKIEKLENKLKLKETKGKEAKVLKARLKLQEKLLKSKFEEKERIKAGIPPKILAGTVPIIPASLGTPTGLKGIKQGLKQLYGIGGKSGKGVKLKKVKGKANTYSLKVSKAQQKKILATQKRLKAYARKKAVSDFMKSPLKAKAKTISKKLVPSKLRNLVNKNVAKIKKAYARSRTRKVAYQGKGVTVYKGTRFTKPKLRMPKVKKPKFKTLEQIKRAYKRVKGRYVTYVKKGNRYVKKYLTPKQYKKQIKAVMEANKQKFYKYNANLEKKLTKTPLGRRINNYLKKKFQGRRLQKEYKKVLDSGKQKYYKYNKKLIEKYLKPTIKESVKAKIKAYRDRKFYKQLKISGKLRGKIRYKQTRARYLKEKLGREIKSVLARQKKPESFTLKIRNGKASLRMPRGKVPEWRIKRQLSILNKKQNEKLLRATLKNASPKTRKSIIRNLKRGSSKITQADIKALSQGKISGSLSKKLSQGKIKSTLGKELSKGKFNLNRKLEREFSKSRFNLNKKQIKAISKSKFEDLGDVSGGRFSPQPSRSGQQLQLRRITSNGKEYYIPRSMEAEKFKALSTKNKIKFLKILKKEINKVKKQYQASGGKGVNKKYINKQIALLRLKNLNNLKPWLTYSSIIKALYKSKVISATKFKQLQQAKTKQIIGTKETVVPKPTVTTTTALKQIPIQPTTLKTVQVQVPRRIIKALPFDLNKKQEKLLSKKGYKMGYNVYGKSGNKYLKINKQPLSKLDAISKGTYAIDRTTSKTLKIEPIGVFKSLGYLSKKEKSYASKNKHKFREYKIKKGVALKLKQKYIEKRRYGIDTYGEKRGLTLARYLAKQNPKKRMKGGRIWYGWKSNRKIRK